MGHPSVHPMGVTIFDKEETADGWTLCVLDAAESLLLDNKIVERGADGSVVWEWRGRVLRRVRL